MAAVRLLLNQLGRQNGPPPIHAMNGGKFSQGIACYIDCTNLALAAMQKPYKHWEAPAAR